MPSLFSKHDVDEHALSLADYLPNGKLFTAKKIPGTKLYSLLRGLSFLLADAEEKTSLLVSEYDIQTTTLFIEEWEEFVGIPDDCFDNTGSLETRRQNILVKLTSLGAQSVEDFVAIAAIFGITVQILPGTQHGFFPLTFPILLAATDKQVRFTMICAFVSSEAPIFPLTFTFSFGDTNSKVIECLFKKIKPANVDLLFHYVGA